MFVLFKKQVRLVLKTARLVLGHVGLVLGHVSLVLRMFVLFNKTSLSCLKDVFVESKTSLN